MKYISLCSGIEAATVAWEPLGWEPAAFAEFDQFPSAVLAHHYPDVPNLGDISKIDGKKYKDTDIVVGGTPCQSFSVAGLREGLDDERGNLAFEFCRLVREIQPLWFVWENVPGVLSSNEGRDFGSILGAMGELGYGVCWRVLDAQFFRVAQRRRRLFVVGYLGDWRPASAVLFEPESLRGDPTASRKTGKGIADSAQGGARDQGSTVGALCARDYKGVGSQFVDEGKVFPEVAQTVTAREHKGVTCGGFGITGNPVVQVTPIQDQATRHQGSSGKGKGNGLGVGKEGDPAHTLTGGDRHAVAYRKSRRAQSVDDNETWVDDGKANTLNAFDSGDVRATHAVVQESEVASFMGGQGADAGSIAYSKEVTPTLRSNAGGNTVPMVQAPTITASNDPSRSPQSSEVTQQVAAVHEASLTVRRLTPIECERLQGFPDDYTKIPYRGKPAEKCPDGPRYKACGNSMAVPVMRWIGERIDLFMKQQDGR